MPTREDLAESWGRQPGEPVKAYEAFFTYFTMLPRERSIAKAYRRSMGVEETDTSVKSSGRWVDWSVKYRWVKRASDYDTYRLERDLQLWEQRREAARERDWQQAEALRVIVDGALPSANQFFRRQVGQPQGGVPTVVNEQGQIIREGVPAQVVITVAFDVVGITTVLEKASKIQRLTLNESTDNINNLSGVVLDAALERALRELALERTPDAGETGLTEGDLAEDWTFDAEEDFDEGAED